MPKELPPPHSAKVVEQIICVIRSCGLHSVHYIGAADEGLLRALLAHEPRLEISVMDMPNRWDSGTRFFWDEFADLGMEYPECPDWLKDVVFYQEGTPDHEVSILDWPWYSADQLRKIVRFTGRKPPAVLILIGDALTYQENVRAWIPDREEWGTQTIQHPFTFQHSSYDWQQVGELWIGRWKAGKISYYERRKRAQQQTNDSL